MTVEELAKLARAFLEEVPAFGGGYGPWECHGCQSTINEATGEHAPYRGQPAWPDCPYQLARKALEAALNEVGA